jgi:exopolyphosphatase/guanosine-5'-triphosphate,3'-diphosphate pyrophosphatase
VSAQDHPAVIAAVDLGSNSFHMVVARRGDGEVAILDRIREMVRLGAGLDTAGRIAPEAASRALDCLSRFNERLAALDAGQVRAVGTNTLRRARRSRGFLRRAEAALGHPIEVISGVEEARLIYLGAARSLPAQPGRRLVVDIGGGSTELIIGEGYEALRLESLYMGCVGLSELFFGEGRVSARRYRDARLFARQELEPVCEAYRNEGWEEAIGTSGTIRATARVLESLGGEPGEITAEGLQALQQRLEQSGDMASHGLAGLSGQRAPVFPGGVAILAETFDALGISRMTVADGALREGLLWDTLGRLSDEDSRDRSVRAFQQRCHVDIAHAERVETTARALLGETAEAWELGGEAPARLLGWAVRLHEVGLDIAHAHHHRHAAYLVGNAHLAGFSVGEQQLLAALVGAHRRKIRPETLSGFDETWDPRLPLLLALLRLAVVLHRSRSPDPLPPFGVKAGRRKLRLKFPEGWLDAHPLTHADLETESNYLAALDLSLGCR